MGQSFDLAVRDVALAEGTIDHGHEVEDGEVARGTQQDVARSVDRKVLAFNSRGDFVESRAHQPCAPRPYRGSSRREARHVLRQRWQPPFVQPSRGHVSEDGVRR